MCAPSVYLLGVGGMGMTPLAIYLSELGFQVYASDDSPILPWVLQWFKEKNIQLTHVLPENCDHCVFSSAILPDHPLRKEAENRKWLLQARGVFLAELLRNKKTIAIIGSHGKSSVCAWTIHLLRTLSVPFNYLLGAHFQNERILPAKCTPANEWVVLEVDESDGTLESFSPEWTIVLNDDWDHPAHYPSADAYRQVLKRFCERTRSHVFLSENIAWLKNLPNTVPIFTFGEHGNFLGKWQDLAPNLVELKLSGFFPQATYKIPRQLSLDNLLAALTLVFNFTQELPEEMAFKLFPGIKRRQEVLFETDFLKVVSDYAHHPTEIDAYLNFSQKRFPGKQWLIYEPHRASRTRAFHVEFGRVLNKAEHLVLMPIYQAFENDFSPEMLGLIEQHLKSSEPPSVLDVDLFLSKLEELSEPLVLSFVGAGKIDSYAKKWVQALKEKMYQRFCQENKIECSVGCEVDLAPKSTFALGGKAMFFACPSSLEELQQILRTCKRLRLPWFVLGLGSNVLIPQSGFNGFVLQLRGDYWQTISPVSDYCFEIGTGIALKKLLDFMQAKGVGGFEFLEGIPGTLGGALKMNAGTGTQFLFERVESLSFVMEDGVSQTLSREEISYGYRSCKTLDKGVAVKVVLKGYAESSETIAKKRLLSREKRDLSQPKGKSLGCFFKNTVDESAGKLLDRLGLKNARVGGAFVSSKHANFILNDGHATFEDVIALMGHIKATVYKHTGVLLEPEIRVLGKHWKELL